MMACGLVWRERRLERGEVLGEEARERCYERRRERSWYGLERRRASCE
jgi:hypothetical protein